jgi:2-polyprenyl-3-methyl-5-hydroxy-6-metoxy-1,4-benzoquinol methylase
MTADSREQLTRQIKELRPWHHDIQLFDDFTTGGVFSPDRKLDRLDNDGVSLLSPREGYLAQLDQIYPNGMSGKSFLDCACNGGGYCFWSRERDIARGVGFDVREHWIRQAKWVQQHRTLFPTDRLEFQVMDLYDLPKMGYEPFDMTYFSGIFYHLPDPITGLKIAADLTTDVLVLNTALKIDPKNPLGMTLARESRTKMMSGVHELAWFPNGKETLREILLWLEFKDLKITMFNHNQHKSRSRIMIVAAREEGRLSDLEGESLTSGGT